MRSTLTYSGLSGILNGESVNIGLIHTVFFVIFLWILPDDALILFTKTPELFKANIFQKVDDIDHLNNHFNALYEKVILTAIEEVACNAGEYRKVQNKIKTQTTEKYIKIEKKGVDSYMSLSHNNYILCTNDENPIYITKDNRRYLVIKVSNEVQNNSEYFRQLKMEVKEKIEEIRGYFYNYKFIDDLNSIRPTTDAEMDVLELNKSPSELFLDLIYFHLRLIMKIIVQPSFLIVQEIVP